MFEGRDFLAAVAAGAVLVTSPQGCAQNFFDELFGSAAPSAQSAAEVDYPYPTQRAADPSWTRRFGNRRVDRRSGPKRAPKTSTDAEATRNKGFCVRACDGYFFPLVKSGHSTKQQSCEYGCPSAPVAVYEGATIETSRNLAGEKYTSLPVAFRFRDKTTQNCSCNSPQHAQSFSLPVLSKDPTLRTGDIVFGGGGAFVYQGAKLVPMERSSVISSAAREKVRVLLAAARVRQQAGRGEKRVSEPIQARAAEAKDAVVDRAAVQDAETAQTVAVASTENVLSVSPALILIVGAGFLVSIVMKAKVAMRSRKAGISAGSLVMGLVGEVDRHLFELPREGEGRLEVRRQP